MNADAVGDPVGLLEVVRDDHDREALAQLADQLLDRRRRARVERRARLVEQQHLGPRGQRARDAQPLLLAAGQPQRRPVEVVADLLPQPRALERGLHRRLERRALDPPRALLAQRVGDVVEDRHRERVGLLEDHRDRAAAARVTSSASTSSPSSRMRPPRAAPGVSSTSRFSDRSSVVFPHPDGPISASTSPWCTGSVDVVDRDLAAVGDRDRVGAHALDERAARPGRARRRSGAWPLVSGATTGTCGASTTIRRIGGGGISGSIRASPSRGRSDRPPS